ncbi:repressor of the inhibitor of the protein kinase [Nymphon striatum]|nr:repressor of the inhibitor of the protein kinase [Nymphon striatum]
MRGQAYDTTAAMSSANRGLQGLFLRDVPNAIYTPCNSHKLNLVIASASKLQQIKKCITEVNETYLFFNASHKRQGILERVIDIVVARDRQLPEGRKHSEQHKLKGLCKTRWVARFEAIDNFNDQSSSIQTECDIIIKPHLYVDDETISELFKEAWNSDADTKTGHKTEMVMDTIIKSSVSDASTQTDNMDIIIKNIEKEHNYATKYGQVHKVAQTVPIPPPQIDFSQEEDYEYKDDAYASTQTDNMDIIIKNIEKEHNYATKYGQVHKYKDDACDLDYESNSSFLSDSDWSDSEPEEFNEVGDDEYGGPAEEQTYLVFESSRELEIKILEHDNYTSELDLFGEDSVIPILHEIFDLAFPLSNRKLDFCRYKQAPGQTFTDCMTNLKQEGQTADLHSLDIDTLYVFRYVTGINDSNLRERFLKLENPNLNQFNMYILSK